LNATLDGSVPSSLPALGPTVADVASGRTSRWKCVALTRKAWQMRKSSSRPAAAGDLTTLLLPLPILGLKLLLPGESYRAQYTTALADVEAARGGLARGGTCGPLPA
jgi:hypothetical protein